MADMRKRLEKTRCRNPNQIPAGAGMTEAATTPFSGCTTSFSDGLNRRKSSLKTVGRILESDVSPQGKASEPSLRMFVGFKNPTYGDCAGMMQQ